MHEALPKKKSCFFLGLLEVSLIYWSHSMEHDLQTGSEPARKNTASI